MIDMGQTIVNLADVIFLVLLVVFALLGWKSGFLKMGFGLVSYGISLILAGWLFPYVSDFLSKTALYDGIFSHAKENGTEAFFKSEGLFGMLSSTQDAVAGFLTTIVLNVISFLVVVILVKVLLFLVSKLLKVFNSLPVLGLVNRLIGLVLGILEGLLVAVLALSLIRIVAPLRENPILEREIDKSVMVYQMYYENPLLSALQPREEVPAETEDMTEKN